jgi:rhamnosyltransferase
MEKLAVLIPTLNAGNMWQDVLESITRQSCCISEKIIIDSGSTDDTIALAAHFGFKVIPISKDEFNHGAARQRLVNESEAEICVFLTQDAILTNSDSIKNLVTAFKDNQVGLAFGRQLPHKNATALETHARLFNYPGISYTRSFSDRNKFGFRVFFCSNSFAAYRRTALSSVGGFPHYSIMGEDALVSAKMLINGFKVSYIAEAMVYHSHSYTLKAEFKRYFDTRVFHEQNLWLILHYGKPTGEGIRFLKSEVKYVIRHDFKSIFKSVSSLGAKWLGYQLGRFYKKIPYSLLKNFSMHKYYWEKKII